MWETTENADIKQNGRLNYPLPRPPASALEPREQAGSVPALAAHLFDLRIEGIDQRGHRQARPVAPRFGKTDRKILAHPFHCEAEIEFALVHGLVAVFHLPRLGCALRNRVDHRLDVQAGLLR